MRYCWDTKINIRQTTTKKTRMEFLVLVLWCKMRHALHNCNCSLCCSGLMKSVRMFMWSWVCLLFFLIIVKREPNASCCGEQRSRSAQPRLGLRRGVGTLTTVPGSCGGGGDGGGGGVCFGTIYNMCESHQQQNLVWNPGKDESMTLGSVPELSWV